MRRKIDFYKIMGLVLPGLFLFSSCDKKDDDPFANKVPEISLVSVHLYQVV